MQASPGILKILVAGPKGSGKTSLICRIIFDSIDECREMPGQYQKYSFAENNGEALSFLFKEVNALPAPEKKAGYILTLNSNSQSDLDTVGDTVSMISDRKYVIALTMSDLHYSAKFWVDDIKKALRRKDVPILPVSAKTGENVPELLSALTDLVKK